MLIGFFGNLGAGKTLLSTIFAINSLKKEILSNYNIKNEKYRKLELIDLLELPSNIDMFIDEAYTWIESRASLNLLNLYLSYILFQSRKRTIDIYITAQLESTIDIRFRELCNVHFLCYAIKDAYMNPIAFYYEIFVGKKYLTDFYLLEENVREYYQYYDTYEIIEPRNFKKLKIELLSSSVDKLIPFLLEQNTDILKLCEKNKKGIYTKTSIKAALSTLNLPLRLSDFYYKKLNE